jgi:hypothetical protein
MSFEIKEENFSSMTKELLTNLGFRVVKEQHHLEKGKSQVGLCIKFDSKIFLPPKYAPEGLTFVECKTGQLRGDKEIKNLDLLIKAANKEETYTKRMGGNIQGGIFVYNGGGDYISQTMLDFANLHKYHFWDIHRVFFYTMKVFSHSILENWVSESKLGFVLREQEINEQFESEYYHTTRFIGIRFSELSENLEIYFSYFCDCLKDPKQATLGINSLHKEHVEKILDDAYLSLQWITKDFYPRNEKNVTIEIHSLSGFTEDAEMGVKLYAPHYRNWKDLGVKHLKVDDHTLFKYSVIPWEAVMDYAFTKRTRRHTSSLDQIHLNLQKIENSFADEIREGVRSEEIKEQFTYKKFITQDNKTVLGYRTIFFAHATKIPIKQRIVLFSKSELKKPRTGEMDKIISELKKDTQYNYTWIGILSGSGFGDNGLEYAKNFNQPGFGLGLIDAVTKRLYVNRNTEEGKTLEKMLLSECIT